MPERRNLFKSVVSDHVYMPEDVQSVKEEILDEFERRLEKNEEIPEEVAALLGTNKDINSLAEDEEVREVIEKVVSENIEVNQSAD